MLNQKLSVLIYLRIEGCFCLRDLSFKGLPHLISLPTNVLNFLVTTFQEFMKLRDFSIQNVQLVLVRVLQ